MPCPLPRLHGHPRVSLPLHLPEVALGGSRAARGNGRLWKKQGPCTFARGPLGADSVCLCVCFGCSLLHQERTHGPKSGAQPVARSVSLGLYPATMSSVQTLRPLRKSPFSCTQYPLSTTGHCSAHVPWVPRPEHTPGKPWLPCCGRVCEESTECAAVSLRDGSTLQPCGCLHTDCAAAPLWDASP